jgi:cell division protease FtsH
MIDFELAKDKVMMGVERKSMAMNDREKKNTAYHGPSSKHRRLQIR